MHLEPPEAMPGLCAVGKFGLGELQDCVPLSRATHLLPLARAGAGHPLRPGIMFLSSGSRVSRRPMLTNLSLESLVRRVSGLQPCVSSHRRCMNFGASVPVHTPSLYPLMHWPLSSGELVATTQARACGGATGLPRVLGDTGALEAPKCLLPWAGVPLVTPRRFPWPCARMGASLTLPSFSREPPPSQAPRL